MAIRRQLLMLNVSIVKTTATSCTLTVDTSITFTKARLTVELEGESEIILDEVSLLGSESSYSVFSIDSNTGEFYIDLNRVPFHSIYYKMFRIVFLDENGDILDSTITFGMTPSGVDHFYGVINKLQEDFRAMATLSGITLRIFLPNLLAEKCPECWDEELGQATSSYCPTCGGANRYTPIDILAKKIKTSSKQKYGKKGVSTKEAVILVTYSRIEFSKGIKVANLATKEIYDITDSSIATIAGIRTSTTIIVESINPGDSRVSDILDLLK